MLFNSLAFPVFLAVGWSIWRLLNTRRWPSFIWLLLISAFFYGCWRPWYLILIAASTLHSFSVGRMLDGNEDPASRRRWLIWGVSGDLGLLAVFKYGNFFLHSLEAIGIGGMPRVPAELPVGISFYTFQTLSYTIDVYKRKIEPTRDLLSFSVFVFFFPQLVAGPIVRARTFLPQLARRPRTDQRAFGEGVFLILAGLAKKMILADMIAHEIVYPFFASPAGRNSLEALIALWAANFQVYCDFSGYSDVAIGAALLFGFQLPKNFDRPFRSRSPMEHWRRWHISLSTWLKDYLYIPLGGSRRGAWRTDFNLFVTFLLGGLWHGAGWTFVIWGVWNGILLVVWRRWVPAPGGGGRGRALIETFATFNAICFGLIFLHAESFAHAAGAFASLADPAAPITDGLPPLGLGFLAGAAALHFSPERWKERLKAAFGAAPGWALGAAAVAAGGVLSLFAGLARPFFYFQF